MIKRGTHAEEYNTKKKRTKKSMYTQKNQNGRHCSKCKDKPRWKGSPRGNISCRIVSFIPENLAKISQ